MSKILVTPVPESGIEPFEVEGIMYTTDSSGQWIHYINGRSYPAEIVTVLED